MRINRLCFLLLRILILRFTRAFQTIRVVATNTPESPLSVRSSSYNNRWNPPFKPAETAATRKMGVGGATTAAESVTETSFNDDKARVTFSSRCILTNNNDEHSIRQPQKTRTALIVLNYPIPSRSLLLDHLWKTSSTRIAADGGANRLYQYSKELIPDRIRGDLDSLDPSVRAYYEKQRVSVEQDFCQDTNDLDKALQALVTDDSSSNVDNVVIYGAFGGRFDQEMASFAALYKWAPLFHGQLYLYSDETCAFLIPANQECEIRLPYYGATPKKHSENDDEPTNDTIEIGEGPTCGLIPLGCRCDSIVTKGLKWDLDGTTPLEFGGLVSSSNRIMEPMVKVLASHPVVFTAELVFKPSI